MGRGRGWGRGALLLMWLGFSAAVADASPAGAAAVHVVARGETLWQIARAHGVSVDAIALANQLSNPAVLPEGRGLRIPLSISAPPGQPPGSVRTPADLERRPAGYRVKAGDTLWSIARRHGTTMSILLRLNGLRENAILRVGQRLRVPAPERGKPVRAPRAGADTGEVAAARRSALAMLWPSRGVVTSRFGLRHRRLHAGIDIGVVPRTPVVAAREGVVTFAGRRGAYGLLVVVDHGAGLTTRYGHLASIRARVGQRVAAGEAIGVSGRSGNATGWILHFEVRHGGQPMDPFPMLGQVRSK